MVRRFTHSLLLCAALLVAALTLPAADKPAAKKDAPPPAKLERKNFTQKVESYKLITDASTKESTKSDMKGQFEMVYIPGGEVTVGSPDTEAGRLPNEGPRYKAKVGSFWMQKVEVTWNDWDMFWYDEQFLKADHKDAAKLGPDAVTRPTNTFLDETYDHGRDGHPALSMTHHAAMVYCEWLRKKTGRLYRLPTEAEFEYAARGGKGDTAYFFGNDPKELAEYAWFAENSKDEDFPEKPKGCTHKVGSRKPNPFGIHDLYGNVSEWALDQYDPKTYENRAKNMLNLNPVNVPTSDKWAHVIRGGSWADKADKLRSASRRVSEESWQKHDPQEPRSIWWLTRMDVVGFRVVLAEEEQPALAAMKPKVVKKSE
ncbi:MAG: sulfatase-modifying factor protein [Planctomycetaceae bacterium]|nr:sulfatase-modifying factor protein [Planctomycetaceae bacterium]